MDEVRKLREDLEANRTNRTPVLASNRVREELKNPFTENGDELLAENEELHSDLIQTEQLLATAKSEVMGLQQAQPEFSKALRQNMVSLSNAQLDVMNVVNNWPKEKDWAKYIIPAGIILVILALVYEAFNNPSFGQGVQEDIHNPWLVLAIIIMVGLVAYIFRNVRQRRKTRRESLI